MNYDLRVSTSSYPTEWFSRVLVNNSRFNELINAYFDELNLTRVNYNNKFAELKDSIARVNVYYEDLAYTQVSENPAISLAALLGTLGGNMGLFLGNYFLRYMV